MCPSPSIFSSAAQRYYCSHVAPKIQKLRVLALTVHRGILESFNSSCDNYTELAQLLNQATDELLVSLRQVNDIAQYKHFLEQFSSIKDTVTPITFGSSPDTYVVPVMSVREFHNTTDPMRTNIRVMQCANDYVKANMLTPSKRDLPVFDEDLNIPEFLKKPAAKDPLKSPTWLLPASETDRGSLKQTACTHLAHLLGEALLSWEKIKKEYEINSIADIHDDTRPMTLISYLGDYIDKTDWANPDKNYSALIGNFTDHYVSVMAGHAPGYTDYTVIGSRVSADHILRAEINDFVAPENGPLLDVVIDPILSFYECIIKPWSQLFAVEAEAQRQRNGVVREEVLDMLVIYFANQRVATLTNSTAPFFESFLRSEFNIRLRSEKIFAVELAEVEKLKALLTPEAMAAQGWANIYAQVTSVPMFTDNLDERLASINQYSTLQQLITEWSFTAVNNLRTCKLVPGGGDITPQIKTIAMVDWFVLRDNSSLEDFLKQEIKALASVSCPRDNKVLRIEYITNILAQAVATIDFAKIPKMNDFVVQKTMPTPMSQMLNADLVKALRFDTKKALVDYVVKGESSEILRNATRHAIHALKKLLETSSSALTDSEIVDSLYQVNFFTAQNAVQLKFLRSLADTLEDKQVSADDLSTVFRTFFSE